MDEYWVRIRYFKIEKVELGVIKACDQKLAIGADCDVFNSCSSGEYKTLDGATGRAEVRYGVQGRTIAAEEEND